ncbi:hypothetical protein Q6A91_08945 [Aliarcobacter skirrowii]|uniref:hypothetical protein n=1 Tax=Aliarcobacter skirrowii TaxID=28200 RepID=UPI00299FC297|nr:hypothetical protein [Aliarcobacter skirrowii]MDX4066143.1 hypothetical protein [Aliarcobacter skirrowii]
MSKIEKLSLNKTIDYSGETISYLIKEDDTNSNLQSYEEIVHKIHNAKKTIQLSSTENISNEIIDALYANNEANIYIILKSFDSAKQTLDRFDSRNPAVLREVKEIENNIIIIDNISYVFINSLDNKENIFIKIDEYKTKDLKYIFNHYFWDCSTLEKLVDDISAPVESPFPLISQRELDYINIAEYDLDNIEKLYLPRDKKYKSILLDKQSEYKYISDDINSIIYQKQNLLQIGRLLFKEIRFNITNKWVFKQNILKDIRKENRIIPIDENWHETTNIQDNKKIQLESIEAKTIEEMETTQAEILVEKYIKEINFSWEVIPPLKPTNAKKSDLYSSYEKLNNEFKNQLDILNSVLIDLEKESSIIDIFIGANRKAKQNIKKIEEYKTKDLTKLSKVDLEKFIEIEFKEFFESIIKANTDFKEDKKRKESEDKWKNEKEQKIKNLKSKETELAEKNKELNSLKDEHKKGKLDKNIKSIEFEINKLNKELADNYFEFKYNTKQNEIKNFNKNKTNSNEYKKLNIPTFILPEVGVLYETNNSYFLEIVYKKDISKANELKQRYCDKDYKVVVGAKDE